MQSINAVLLDYICQLHHIAKVALYFIGYRAMFFLFFLLDYDSVGLMAYNLTVLPPRPEIHAKHLIGNLILPVKRNC